MGIFERRSLALRLVLLLAAGVVIAGCAGGTSTVLSSVGKPIDSEAQPKGAAGAAPSAGPAAPERAASGPQFDQNGNLLAAPRDDLRIVYTGSLQLVVADLQPALAKAKAAVAALGGYVGASQEVNDGQKSVATITYRIPATRWEDAKGALRALAAKVVGEQTQATEVGGQLIDLEARIRNLRTGEAALLEIAKSAGKISDLLVVQAQITEIRGQIEQLDGQRAKLTDQVAYGTLVTTFGLEIVAVQETARGWDPARDVDSATATLIGAGQAFVSAAIWFGIVWLPLILVLLLIVIASRLLLRRFAPKPRHDDPIPGWGAG